MKAQIEGKGDDVSIVPDARHGVLRVLRVEHLHRFCALAHTPPYVGQRCVDLPRKGGGYVHVATHHPETDTAEGVTGAVLARKDYEPVADVARARVHQFVRYIGFYVVGRLFFLGFNAVFPDDGPVDVVSLVDDTPQVVAAAMAVETGGDARSTAPLNVPHVAHVDAS